MNIHVYSFTFHTGVKYEVFTLDGEPYVVYGRFQALFGLKAPLRAALCEFYSSDRGCVSGDALAALKKYSTKLHIRSGTPKITVFPLATVIELGKETYPFLEDIGKQFRREEDEDIEEESEEPVVSKKRGRDVEEIKNYIDNKFTEMSEHFEIVHKKWYSEEYMLELKSLAIEKVAIEEQKRVYDLEKNLAATQQELDKVLAENQQLIEKAKKLSAVSRYIEMINSEIH